MAGPTGAGGPVLAAVSFTHLNFSHCICAPHQPADGWAAALGESKRDEQTRGEGVGRVEKGAWPDDEYRQLVVGDCDMIGVAADKDMVKGVATGEQWQKV